MRLLTRKDNGTVDLREFHGQDVPPYAILSHTWGDDEVLFQHIHDGTAQSRRGYQKIEFCADQAAKDGLQYFWIDTCCIDKSSIVELQEAINSMFRWYQSAVHCYALLSDVKSGWRANIFNERERSAASQEFFDCRWFSRAWTLPELLAPRDLTFFTADGEFMDRRSGLVETISLRTGIPARALSDCPLSAFGVDERLSWSTSRRSTRPEDEAYSLLGIFHINMPLIYGEGKKHAMTRLLGILEREGVEVVMKPGVVLAEHGAALAGMNPKIALSHTTSSPVGLTAKALGEHDEYSRTMAKEYGPEMLYRQFHNSDLGLKRKRKPSIAQPQAQLDPLTEPGSQSLHDVSPWLDHDPVRQEGHVSEPVDSIAFAVLEDWFEAHSDFPYPDAEEQANLVKLSSLTSRQVDRWFEDARQRRTHSAGPLEYWLSSSSEDEAADLEDIRRAADRPAMEVESTSRVHRPQTLELGANEESLRSRETTVSNPHLQSQNRRDDSSDSSDGSDMGSNSSIGPGSMSSASTFSHKSVTVSKKPKSSDVGLHDDIYEADHDDADVKSVFSEADSSASSVSATGFGVQAMAVREITAALLGRNDLAQLCTTAVVKVSRSKLRKHLRGFLKQYGQDLALVADGDSLSSQAAQFVRRLAGRIADQICAEIVIREEETRPPRLEYPRRDLEKWLTSIQGAQITVYSEQKPVSATPEGGIFDDDFDSSGTESDGETHEDSQFPNIEKIKEFLMESEALETLVQALKTWLDVDKTTAVGTRKHRIIEHDTAEHEGEAAPAAEVGLFDRFEVADGSKDSDTLLNNVQSSASETAQHAALTSKSESDNKRNPFLRSPSLESGSSWIEAPHDDWNVLVGRITYLIDCWANWALPLHGFSLFRPPVAVGCKRLEWKCSCGTSLWDDFPLDASNNLHAIEQELLEEGSPPGENHSESAKTGQEPSKTPDSQKSSSQAPGQGSGVARTTGSNGSRPSPPNDPTAASAPHKVSVNIPPMFLELCINVGNHMIDHYELDIRNISTDGELFRLIWEKYDKSRGIGIRRLFLRPRTLHFVLAMDRDSRDDTGIHKKPDEYPPITEVNEKRYHYECPKMPVANNTFLDHMHKARWHKPGVHTKTVFLRNLPKKLNKSVFAEDKPAELVDPEVAFGWGVHIIDGPNHSVLCVLLVIGISISFVISGMVVGFAKTQEQGFGIGSYLLAILALIIPAIYFRLQDM